MSTSQGESLGISQSVLKHATANLGSAADKTTSFTDRLNTASAASGALSTALGLLNSVWAVVLERAPKLNDQVTRIKDEFAEMAGIMGSSLVPAFEVLADLVEGAVSAFRGLPGPVKDVLGVAFALVSGLVALGTAVATVQATVLALQVTFGSLLGPLLAVAAVAGLLYIAWKNNLFGMREAVSKFVSFVKPLVTGFLERLRTLWKTHFGTLRSETKRTMNALAPLFKAAFAVVKTVTKVAWSLISTLILQRIDGILTFVRAALALLRGDWEGAWNIIVGYVERTVDRIAGLVERFGAIFGDILKAAVRFSVGLGAIVTKLGTRLVTGFEVMLERSKANVKRGLDGIVSIYETAANSIIGVVNDLTGHIQRQFNEMAGGLNEFLPDDEELPTLQFGTVGDISAGQSFDPRSQEDIRSAAQRRLQDRLDAVDRRRKRRVKELTSKIEETFGSAVQSSSPDSSGGTASTDSPTGGSTTGTDGTAETAAGLGGAGKSLVRTEQPTACSRQPPLQQTGPCHEDGVPNPGRTAGSGDQTNNVNIERLEVNSRAPAPNSRRDSSRLAEDISSRFADEMGRR